MDSLLDQVVAKVEAEAAKEKAAAEEEARRSKRHLSGL